MRLYGFGGPLDNPTHVAHCRKDLHLTMNISVHDDLQLLKALVDGEQALLRMRQVIMCQVILKNVDISNPVSGVMILFFFLSFLYYDLVISNLDSNPPSSISTPPPSFSTPPPYSTTHIDSPHPHLQTLNNRTDERTVRS